MRLISTVNTISWRRLQAVINQANLYNQPTSSLCFYESTALNEAAEVPWF
jgi:hypothetical protein